MFWADRIAGEARERFARALSAGGSIVIRDEKTVSGRVHIGSMRGVAIHGAVSEALSAQGAANAFLYEFNDFDPMDDIPSYLDRAAFEEHLGKPLKDVPSPDPSAASFAEYFAGDFRAAIEKAGFAPEYRWGSEAYRSGMMDGVIREALEGAEAVRRIYKEVSGGERAQGWLPLSVVCPQCGKLSTTEASGFDGETVLARCREDKVAWTKGCGFEGRVSPFGGAAKLPWKVEWAAKWKVFGVGVEGAGKDHSTKGGSRDVAARVSREVFRHEPPIDAPYEFFLVGGRKMSSSKGRGSSAREIAELLPRKILRLALMGKDIGQQINFDPEGDAIPVLYDQYDKLAEGYRAQKGDDYARLFELLHGGEPGFAVRFSQVAFIVQMPHMDLQAEAEKMKGSPLTGEERAELQERAEYARKWLDAYAPEKFVFKLQDSLPEPAKGFSDTQKKALAALAAELGKDEGMPSGEAIQQMLFDIKEAQGIAPAELFSAIYLAFLGKPSGPKAGWFLSVLEKDSVLKRLAEASA